MAAVISREQLKEAYEKLTDGTTKKIFLTGDHGVGKTWMARMLSDRAIRDKKFDIVLWLFLNRKYDKTTLYETFAHQLSLVSTPNEYEVEDEDKDEDEDEAKSSKRNGKDNLEEKEEKVYAKLMGKRVLLIMDDLEDPSSVETILPNELKPEKILITTCKTVDIDTITHMVPVRHLSEDESSSLLKGIVGLEKVETFIKLLPANIIILAKALKHFSGNELLRMEIAKAEALVQDGRRYNVMQLLLNGYELLPRSVLFDWYRPDNQFLQHGESLHYKELIAYWILEGYLGHFDRIGNAYEKGHSVLMELLECGLLKEQTDGYVMVNRLDLTQDPSDIGEPIGTRSDITLDPFDLCEFVGTIPLGLGNISNDDFGSIVKTNGMIKILCTGEEKKTASALLVDGNHLGTEIPKDLHQSMKEVEVLAIFNSTDDSLPLPLFKVPNRRLLVVRHCDFLESINEALEIQSQPNPSVSNVDHTDDLLNTSQAPDRDTNAPPKVETPSPSPISALETTVQKLTVLEISGPCSLKEIPDEVFKSMLNLQSLNLSFLQISLLPQSFKNLSKLVYLILRGCSNLTTLGSLKNCAKLQVLDLSGAKSFSRFEDRVLANKELQTLNLSQSQIKKLPLLRDLQNLNHLLLRGCTQLGRLPKISALTKLQILDLLGATNFKEFHDPSLEKLTELKLINISQTAVKKLPLHMSNPRALFLSGCTRLKRLSFIESMKDLEILDVSGCSSLEWINKNFFQGLERLQEFNLSSTQVETLPSLSKLSDLRKLLVSNCLSLKDLGELTSLGKLEVLDLSGSKALKELKSFKELSNLEVLNISGTQITCLPELSDSSNLRELFLKNCTELKELSSSAMISKLEKLNLSGASALAKIQDGFFNDMANLSTLDLSETKITNLPSLSKVKRLCCLLLRNCQNLEEVPDLEKITTLEELDLSGTAVNKLPKFEESSQLRCLLLKDCSKLDEFNQDEILCLLQDPGRELPCNISRLTGFRVLELPSIATADQEYQWSISLPAPSPITAKFSISMNCVQFLQLLEKNESLQTGLSDFNLYVHPVEVKTRFGDKFSKDELFFRKINIQAKHLSWKKEEQGSPETQGIATVNNQMGETSMEKKQGYLDVHGFDHFPKGLERVLPYTTNAFLISNPFLRCLTDLNAENIKEMKVCWIENCSNLKTVLPVDKVETAAAIGDDVKGASEAGKNEEDSADISESRGVHSGSLRSNSFGTLMCLYLEHCPELSYICQSSQQLGNLVVLQIKYCKSLKTLFVDESAQLPKLQKLQLWELPNLEKIMCKLSSLSTLNVGECPYLERILSSTHLPTGLKVLEIRFCDKLKNVFEGSKVKLSKLQRLHLWDLPELQNIGADFPQNYSIESCSIRGCPVLSSLPVASGGV